MLIQGENHVKENQNRLLEFIAKAISKVEGEQFVIKRIDLCSRLYTLSPSNIVIGHMFIICNNEYLEKAKTLLNGDNRTVYECSLPMDETSKALLLKYQPKLYKNDYVYKFKDDGLTRLLNETLFPYLREIIDMLFKNIEGNKITKEVIEKTLEQIPSKENLLSTEQATVGLRKAKVMTILNKSSNQTLNFKLV